jgi:hypothetical protein
MRLSNQGARDQQKGLNAAETERQSVVTPLFTPQITSRRTAVVRFRSVATVKRALALVGSLLALAGAAFWLNQNRHQERATERIALGCLDVADCRAVLQNIETLHANCLFDCSHLSPLAEQARKQFRVVLEQRAQQEQVSQDQAYKSAIQSRRAAEEETAKLLQATRLAEREHEHRLELERIGLQTERLQNLRTSAQGAQLQYFKQLSPEQRLNRLHACHKRGTTCEDLVQQLAQAAPSLAEQRALIAAHEEYVTSDPDDAPAPGAMAKLSDSISQSSDAERL